MATTNLSKQDQAAQNGTPALCLTHSEAIHGGGSATRFEDVSTGTQQQDVVILQDGLNFLNVFGLYETLSKLSQCIQLWPCAFDKAQACCDAVFLHNAYELTRVFLSSGIKLYGDYDGANLLASEVGKRGEWNVEGDVEFPYWWSAPRRVNGFVLPGDAGDKYSCVILDDGGECFELAAQRLYYIL